MKLPRFLILFIALCLCSSLLAQKVAPETASKLDGLFSGWNSTHTPGGAVAIIQDGQIVYSKAFGMSSLEYDVPNTTETIFNIASVSKQITAFSIILLEQQGKLSIDDDVRKYLPEVPDFGTTITIRHLLTHTSGLRNFQNMLSLAGWRRGDAMTNEDLLKFIARQKELNFPVGSEYLYCNSGFNLATAIVERITGKRFQDWTKANIFEPLGMNRTSYREDLEKVHKNTATSYLDGPAGGFIQPRKYWTYMGNGNVYTTIGDMAKWINNFDKAPLGGKSAIERLQEQGILTSGEKINYALGIGVRAYRGLKILQHGGAVGGYRSNLIYFPEKKTGIIVFSNFSSANPGGKAFAMADTYLANQFPEPKPKRRESVKIKREAVTIDKKIYQELEGNYWVSGGFMLELFWKDNQLFGKTEDGTVTVMAASDSTFWVKELPYSMIAHRNKQNKVDRLTVFAPNRQTGKRIDTSILTSENLEKYEGQYYSPELGTYYQVQLEEGKLVVHHTRHNDFYLTPISSEQLVGSASFFSGVKVERNEDNTIKGIRVSNGRVRNLWFRKIKD